MERRSFFKWLFTTVAALWTAGVMGVIYKYLKSPETPASLGGNLVRVGPVEELPVGSCQFVEHERHPIWVLRLPSNEVIAVSAICTHFHCVLNWDDGAKIFRCPCHQGSFDQYGNVLTGPPPAPLPKLAVELRRGEVYVRLS